MRHFSLAKAAGGMLGIAALGLAMAPPAAADPKGGEVIPIQCDVNGPLEVTAFGNGEWTPGLVVGTNQVAIPYRFHFEGTFTPIVGEPESFVWDSEKPAPRNGRLDHCTFHQEGSDESGSFTVDGAVWISYTPAR